MDDGDFIGVNEIASIAGVGSSAVANWRKRFSDFPVPLAELKSGPIFSKASVSIWLERRRGKESMGMTNFYNRLATKRGDSRELREIVEETVTKLENQDTSERKPGILLGKVQSGKTRAFLGIIAASFDRGYDITVILTKGTKSLARQTLTRVKQEFQDFIAADEVQVYDIMTFPDLTPYELNQKLILIVKKEDDNLNRLLDAFQTKHPVLLRKRVLIIDDEADFASVSAKKVKGGVVEIGKVSQQIENVRSLVADSDFLQVTATPYSLYLQPEDDMVLNGTSLFRPKRPAFTVILPSHSQYVGGDYYFEKSADLDSPAYYFYREVPLAEREALKIEDRRRLRIDNVLEQKNAAVLRDAVLTFIVGGAIRRLQQKLAGERLEKYSFLFHTEQSRGSHEWQEKVVKAIRDTLVQEANDNTQIFNDLLLKAYQDLQRSIQRSDIGLPIFESVKSEVVNSLRDGELMVTRVNSDNDVDELLDDDGQLKLRTPFNLFIGGQILDRGITINNLIAFYYGRNPNKFQQDTVLQHSRMYGARSSADLPVTRLYAPQHVYQIMRRIHDFDAALRDAFESGAHDQGVYFIQKDSQNQILPCSPNKLLFSDVFSIRPGRRVLPTGFQTVAKSSGKKNLDKLDKAIAELCVGDCSEPTEISVEKATELLELAYSNLEFDNPKDDDRAVHIAALTLMSRKSQNESLRGKVLLITAQDRNVARYRDEGRFSNAPDTKQQNDLGRLKATSIPVLMLLRQNGEEAQGWRGLPFWWPVIVTPTSAVTSIFASSKPSTS